MSADESGGSAALEKAFDTLNRTAAGRAMHGAADERVRRLREACRRELRAALEEGWFAVGFEDGAVRSKGELVVSVALAGQLEGAGVRGISIERQASDEELDALLELLTREWSRRAHFDEDLTSAVWRCEFENIHLDLVQPPHGDGAGVPGPLDRLRTRLVEGTVEETVCFTATSESARALDEFRRGTGALAQGMEVPELGHLERTVIERDVDAVLAGTDVDDNQVSQVLFEVLRLEFSEQGAREVGEAIGRLALERLDHSDPEGMACLVRRPLVLLRPPFRGRFHHGVAFREGLSRILDDDRRPLLIGALGRLNDPDAARGALFTFLSAAHPASAAQLALLCHECPSPELAQAIADSLIAVLGLDRNKLMDLLQDSDERLHLAPLLAYSRLASTQALGACLLRTRSPEPRIREAALRSVRHHDTERVRKAALDLLDDDDARVRVEAMRHLAVHRDPKAFDKVRDRVFGPEVSDIGEGELKALLITFGILGADDAVDPLMDILLDRREVAGRHARIKSFAVRALMATGTRRGQEGLNEVVRRVPEVRDAVRELRNEKARK